MKGNTRNLVAGAAAAALFLLAGCGSSSVISPSPTPTQTQTTGTVNVAVSDDATQDWATIGVKVLSISLVPQGGGTPVSVYTAPSTPPMINLEQLDQLSEILGNATIATGTYTQAVLTLSANNTATSCDVELIVSGDPGTGFDTANYPAGSTVPCGQTVIAGATGAAGSQTVQVTVNLATPLVVTTTGSNALDLEFDLNHPALLVEHVPASANASNPALWAINFNGPVRHRPHSDLTKLILRHTYGQVATVSTDNTSITIDRAFPVHPITSPETATVDSNHTLSILADATNGTLFYNLDNTSSAPSTIDNFSSIAGTLPTMYVRIAARYQQNGTLVATRIYASKTFNNIWRNPEGHVLHVNTNATSANYNTMWVTTEDGKATQVAIGSNTAFYFRSSNTEIGTGAAFFDGVSAGNLPNVARGFKVNVTIDPLSTATPPVALTVEIDAARYGGTISSPTATDFNYQNIFPMADSRGGKDNYNGTINYATGPTVDQTGNADANGFYWWDFGFPTLEDNTAKAISDFETAVGGASVASTNFGGAVGSLAPVGISSATWNDPAATDAWAAEWTVLLPVGAPLGTISTPFSANSTGGSFMYSVPLPVAAPANSAQPQAVTVDLTSTSGSATLVYQVDRKNGVVTITPEDISNSTTLQTVGGQLIAGVPVKVFGVPVSSTTIKAYVLLYYTDTASTK